MRITGAESTLLFTGTVASPGQVLRVTLADLPSAGPVRVWAAGPGVATPQAFRIEDPEAGQLPEVRTAFELVRLHLDAAREDPDYKFVLAEVDYLKPYFDAHPEDRADLRALLAQGRIEIVGGNYNEPNTNLTCAESTIRNAVYGLGHQRDVLGGDPR